MRVLPASNRYSSYRRSTDSQYYQRPRSGPDRRSTDRRNQPDRRGQDRARHHSQPNNAASDKNQWVSPTFAAHILGQELNSASEASNSIAADRAYDKVINPYLRPMHTRKA
ncbi:hypothetical protein [Hirschia maritima]|uniref:hypothetical protein n=1 Tax=Hirschia maritima TaxID=1121961 RepID=UPI00036A5A16|nr:hypothetical protein [Hirschia maritima]